MNEKNNNWQSKEELYDLARKNNSPQSANEVTSSMSRDRAKQRGSVGERKQVLPADTWNLSGKRMTKLHTEIGSRIHGYMYKEFYVKEFIRKERKIIDIAHFEDWSLTKTFKELDKLAGGKLV